MEEQTAAHRNILRRAARWALLLLLAGVLAACLIPADGETTPTPREDVDTPTLSSEEPGRPKPPATTPTPSATSLPDANATLPTPDASLTDTSLQSGTSTITPTFYFQTPTRTPTRGSPTVSPTVTRTRTRTLSSYTYPTLTRTRTPTRTRTRTPTRTRTRTVSATVTRTKTFTATHTATYTATYTRTPTLRPADLVYSVDSDSDYYLDLAVRRLSESTPVTIYSASGSTVQMGDWSPSGSWIVFDERSASYRQQLSLIHPDGTGRTVISGQPSANNVQSSFSPDSEWVLFRSDIANPDTTGDIFAMQRSGSGLTQLTFDTTGSYVDSMPDWAPNGKSFVFVRGGDIYSQPLTGTVLPYGSPLRWTTTSELEESPHISPDGTMLLFARRTSSRWDVYRVNLDTSGAPIWTTEVRLTDGLNLYDNRFPAWAADGVNIAFISNRTDYQNRVYVMDANGYNQLPVSNTTGALYPVWNPKRE